METNDSIKNDSIKTETIGKMEQLEEAILQEESFEAIDIQSVMTRQDYKSLRYFFLHTMKPRRMRNVVVALIAGVVFLVLGEVGVLSEITLRIGLYGLVLLIFVYLWIDAQASKLEKPVKDIEKHQQNITIDNEGFRVEWIDYSVPFEYTWDLVASVFETEEHFFFFVKRLNAIILPKRDISTQDIIRIRELTEKKIIPMKIQIMRKKDHA